ncbi:MAG: hypothetical protein WD207_05665 [Xanthobacteraceae bacterium]
MAILQGTCHCGRIEVEFETSVSTAQLQVRACMCSFCRRHGAKNATDPDGGLTISFPTGGIDRYRFGHRTADFLICRGCGVYVAAIMEEGGRQRGTLNVVGTRIEGLWERVAEPFTFDHEDPDVRRARRRARWMPAKIVEHGRASSN